MRREKMEDPKYSFNLWERKGERDSSNQCKAEVLDRKWEDINWSNLEATEVPSRVCVFPFWTILQQIRARLKVENSTNWQEKQNPQRFLTKFTRILKYTDMKKTKTRIESADKDDDDEIIRREILRHHESKTLIERLVELTRCGNVVMFARRWKSAIDSSHRRE